MANPKILCVDDDHAQVTIISGVLKKEGYDVQTAFDGSEGLKKAQEWKPDLIVLDIMMPGLDGYQVCTHLKNNSETAKIGVLMLTAKGGVDDPSLRAAQFATRVQDRMKGFDSGALEFLTKPVKAKELVQRVKSVLWASGIV